MTPQVPVRQIRAIEISSRCDLRCVYCPNPKMGGVNRPKLDMDHETFEHALAWVKHFVSKGTQGELNLAGIGESTLHPRFADYVNLAREAVGPKGLLTFTTNGLNFAGPNGVALMRAIAPAKPLIGVSLHRPEKARPAIDTIRENGGLIFSVSADPSIAPISWAGQVDWPVDLPGPMRCGWLGDGMVMVMADGRVTACCLDAGGAGVIGTVKDDPAAALTRPYKLCRTCHHTIDLPGYNQRAEEVSDAK